MRKVRRRRLATATGSLGARFDGYAGLFVEVAGKAVAWCGLPSRRRMFDRATALPTAEAADMTAPTGCLLAQIKVPVRIG